MRRVGEVGRKRKLEYWSDGVLEYWISRNIVAAKAAPIRKND